MSFCRFNGKYGAWPDAPRSDLYVFADVAGGYTCCDCRLQERGEFRAKTADEMVEHVKTHRAVGHAVWDGVEEALLEYGEVYG